MSGGAIIYGVVIAGAVAAPAVFAAAWFKLKQHRKLIAPIGAVLAIPYLLIVYAFMIEPKTLVMRHVTVTSTRWTGPPLRIGIISDLHAGGVHMPPSRVPKIVARMNAEKPDIVLLLGDYVDGHVEADARHVSERDRIDRGILGLRDLRAPGGVLAVIGNHDMLYGVDEVRSTLVAAGLTVLENRSAPAPNGAWIVGLAEYSEEEADYPAAIANAPADAPLIVATHWPDAIALIDKRPLLTLAGHSHCNQVGFDVLTRVIAASPLSRQYRCGLVEVDGHPLYISGGVGTSILPMRFLAPPEIAVVTLQAAN